MSAIASTQPIAMRLITSIVTKDEEGIKKLISPNITLTTVHNGGQPVVKHGEANYLAMIKLLWENMVDYRYGGFLYDKFTPTAGTLNFTQICVVKHDNADAIMLSEGTQTFTFENQRIRAVTVVETDTFLTEEEYTSTIAKITEQKNKIASSVESNSSIANQGICVIL